jgi:hypothetical protein
MDIQELARSKRNKVLPLWVSLRIYGFVYRKKALNQFCDVPYWLTLLPPLILVILLLLLNFLQHGISFSTVTFKVVASSSIIIFIQLLASEAVNRKVIHIFIADITPSIDDLTIWSKIDMHVLKQIGFTAFSTVMGAFLIWRYTDLFSPIRTDWCFICGLAIVLFNTSYGMLMHISSSMSLVQMSSYFSNRLYEFFPTGSPVIRHLANLYSTALLITVLTSIATVSVMVIAFPSPLMFKFAAISLISAIATAIFAFFSHLNSINILIDKGKEKVIAKIQERIDQINQSKEHYLTRNKNALEEIGKLIDISEKIQNAKPRILSINISLKYLLSVVSPIVPLVTNEYTEAIKAMLESIEGNL